MKRDTFQSGLLQRKSKTCQERYFENIANHDRFEEGRTKCAKPAERYSVLCTAIHAMLFQ